MQTTGLISLKWYRCTGKTWNSLGERVTCGKKSQISTNHWGECYPYCQGCRAQTAHECLEPVPEGYGVPEKWKMVKLGDVCEIRVDAFGGYTTVGKIT